MSRLQPLLQEAEERLTRAEFERAAELYRRAVAIDRGRRSPLPLVGEARVAIGQGRLDDARRILEDVLRRFPRCAPALTYLGVVAERQDALEAALLFHTRAIRADSAFAVAYIHLAQVLAQMKLWDEARRAAQLAVELAPRHLPYLLALASISYGAGDAVAAIESYRRALEVDPSRLSTYLALASVLEETNQDDLADQLLATALRWFPRASELHARRAMIATRCGFFDAARRHTARRAEIDARNEQAYLTEALLQAALLDLEAAEQATLRALALNPTSWRAHAQLGALADARGDRATARDRYRAALAAGATDWKPIYRLAALLLEDGASPEARPLLERASELAPSAEAFRCHYHLALACWQLGDRVASEHAARKAVELGPDGHATVENARRFLQRFERAPSRRSAVG